MRLSLNIPNLPTLEKSGEAASLSSSPGKSSVLGCGKMWCRMVMLSKKKKKGAEPVYLNVYDLTPMNGYAYWLGLGVYHSGVQGVSFIYLVYALLFYFIFFFGVFIFNGALGSVWKLRKWRKNEKLGLLMANWSFRL